MGTCMFVASGLNFDVDAYFPGSPFKDQIASVFRKGQIPTRDNPQKIAGPDSGFVHMVSASQEPHLKCQIHPALEFLSKYEKEFARLKGNGVDNMLLAFGMEGQQTIERAQYLPPELIVALSRYHMGLVFSTVRIPTG